jgi:putative membrane protein
MMVADHSKANEELKALAARKNVRLPEDLKLEHKSDKERLAKLSGPAFDEAYASHMVKDHQKAVTLFGQQARTGTDPAAKQWAARTLPTLEQHLAKARDIAGKKASEGGDHKH